MQPRKKWGQHFLTDTNILASIADAADITRNDTILEIGPGLGHLTRVLAQRAGRVVAVEVDAELAARLQNEFAAASNVTIVCGDILRYAPFDLVGAHFKIVANLPYYITSAILRHVLETAHKPRVVVVMVQREVAQRIVARPPAMNLLAVSIQVFARPRVMRVVPAGSFYSRPKVDSAVVRLDVEDAPRVADSARFFEIARAGFGEKRKQLRNALAHGLNLEREFVETALARARINPSRRAETLTLAEWSAVCHALN
ncbi:MAG: ribosomal RNA small subunit methyltransferase A [Chloroflexi bacterium]|nr:ribosomal RNA small subunit methyltransferase A [Chloroflexota bacterium]